MPDVVVIPVVASGAIDGTALEGPATFALVGDGFEVRTAQGSFTVARAALDGVHVQGTTVVLAIAGGGAIRLAGDGKLAAAARELLACACDLPEMTRGMRALGSSRAGAGVDHDLFFAPLLASRKRAERASELRTQLPAFDAAALRAAFEKSVRDTAARRFPDEPPERRALAAELVDLAAPYLEAIDRLAAAAASARSAPEEAQLRYWREWCAAVADVFAAADRLWLSYVPVLAKARGGRVRWWRRLLRRPPTAGGGGRR